MLLVVYTCTCRAFSACNHNSVYSRNKPPPRCTTIDILGIRMRRTCPRRAREKLQVDVTNYGEASCRLCVVLTMCRAVLRLSRSRRVIERSGLRWCWRANLLLWPSFIPLLSTQSSSVSLHSFFGLSSSSILRRVFHHERKRKKEGTRAAGYVNYA